MRITKPGPLSGEEQRFAILMGSMAAIVLAAFGLGFLLKAPPLAQFSFSADAALAGVAAALPLLGLLAWFSKTKLEAIARFRRAQISFFAEIGFTFTPLRITLLALGAGVSEEMLFRGVLQSAIDPVWAAIIFPNILFGLLHARSASYAIIAGLVGVYLGIAFAMTGDLLAPILTHALYDLVALEYTRRAIIEYRREPRENGRKQS